MKSHGIIRKHMKSIKIMKIDEIAASWDRAKVSIGARPRPHRAQQVANIRPLSVKSHEIHENRL